MHVGKLGAMAQMYLKDLAEKTRWGQLGRARKGQESGRQGVWLRRAAGGRNKSPALDARTACSVKVVAGAYNHRQFALPPIAV
jgi:DNA invertase Pin-like site-specific DNA recombinase